MGAPAGGEEGVVVVVVAVVVMLAVAATCGKCRPTITNTTITIAGTATITRRSAVRPEAATIMHN